MQPHEDESLPPQLREALRIMARRGPVVELDGQMVIDDLRATEAEPEPDR